MTQWPFLPNANSNLALLEKTGYVKHFLFTLLARLVQEKITQRDCCTVKQQLLAFAVVSMGKSAAIQVILMLGN